jgi:poly(beta-D-mannuronate) lyase
MNGAASAYESASNLASTMPPGNSTPRHIANAGNIRIAAAALMVVACAAPAFPVEPLASPYAGAPSMKMQARSLSDCPKPPTPSRDIVVESGYAPPDYTRLVPSRVAKRQEATAPLHQYLGKVVELSEIALSRPRGDRVRAMNCADTWLRSWLNKGAMLGEISWPDGYYERTWLMVGLGLSYLQAHAGEEAVNPPAWLKRWFAEATSDLSRRYPADKKEKNNLWYWAGLSAVVAGTLCNDRDLYSWGIAQYEFGLGAINEAGFLPLELKRGQYALHYHAFAASALVMIAAFERANNHESKDGWQEERLKRLVGRVLQGLQDPSEFSERAGAPQHPMDAAGIRSLSWLEQYYALTGDVAAEPWLRRMRPMRVVWLGGNTTNAFGKDIPDGPVAASPLFDP